jgi:hypothetical protein
VDDWSSWFWRADAPPVRPPVAVPAVSDELAAGVWDLRALPAPQPLTALLDRLACAQVPFEALLPMYSDLLEGLIANEGWRSAVVAPVREGVRVHFAPASASRS